MVTQHRKNTFFYPLNFPKIKKKKNGKQIIHMEPKQTGKKLYSNQKTDSRERANVFQQKR